MPADNLTTLSEKALSLLVSRITADNTIKDVLKEAVLVDLMSINPSVFESLSAALTAKVQADEA